MKEVANEQDSGLAGGEVGIGAGTRAGAKAEAIGLEAIEERAELAVDRDVGLERMIVRDVEIENRFVDAVGTLAGIEPIARQQFAPARNRVTRKIARMIATWRTIVPILRTQTP